MRVGKGISLIEVVVAMGFFFILASIITINVFTTRGKALVEEAVTTLVSDMRAQQARAMGGEARPGSVNVSYGIFFERTRYVLFHGATYNPSDPTNAAVAIGENLEVSTVSFPDTQVVFTKGTGEILNFVQGFNTVTLRNTVSSEQKRLRLNRYGVVVALE